MKAKIRFLKISRAVRDVSTSRSAKVSPFLRLQGDWLEKAGFKPGANVKVGVHNQFLTIEPATEMEVVR